MTDMDDHVEETSPMRKLPIAAICLALIGLLDSIYLTVHHLTAEPVPCSLISGCETVLTSPYAEIGGVPLAGFGAAAYFTAFSLSLLGAFGNRNAWFIFGIAATGMAGFTLWLLYLQAFVIGAFCQFCLISAATSLGLFIVGVLSKFWRRTV